MLNQELKHKATKGFLWNTIEKFSNTIAQFFVGIILARLLEPEDFGLIGIITFFTVISQVFIDSGMGSGLIQKQNRTKEDFSTVFIFNIVISLSCYGLLFLSAPWIAAYYEKPELVLLTRVIGLSLIINSLNVVQRTKLEIDVDFKKLAKVNVFSLVLGGALGIGGAFLGFGVWSLVIQVLTISLATTLGFWLIGSWSLSLKFSKESFRSLFSYGSKLLVAGVYAKTLHEVYNLVIGKAYSMGELGYFTQAKKLGDISIGVITSVAQKVSFPILSSLQNDRDKMISMYSKMIRMSAFISFPVMILLAILAEPIIIILLGEKWIPVIPLFRWLCFARLVYPINMINMNILNANGRSDLFLKVDLIKLPIIVIALIITIPLGLEAIVIGQTVTSIMSFFINAYLPKKLFGYGAFDQLFDMKGTIFSALVMSASVFLLLVFVENIYIQLALGLITGALVFLSVAQFIKLYELIQLKSIIKSYMSNLRK